MFVNVCVFAIICFHEQWGSGLLSAVTGYDHGSLSSTQRHVRIKIVHFPLLLFPAKKPKVASVFLTSFSFGLIIERNHLNCLRGLWTCQTQS